MISALSVAAYGGYTYFKNLIPALAELDSENQYTILVKSQHFDDFRIIRENFRFLAVPEGSGSAVRRMIWEQFSLPKMLSRLGANAIYTANNVGILFSPVPVVIAVRNLEPFFYDRYKDGIRQRSRNWLLKWLTNQSVQRANRVVVVSKYAREVMFKSCSVSPSKVRVIYHGRTKITPDDAASNALREEHGMEGEFFFTNSKFVPYSNLHNLVRGYALAKRKLPHLPKLVLAGGDTSRSYKNVVLDLINSNNLKEEVIILGLIPNPVNLSLMRSTRLFLFSTLLEACPNTLIEAMSMGCLIACSQIPPLEEIAGDCAIYFDPVDPGGISETIIRAYGLEKENTEAYKGKAIARSRIFDWNDSAASLVSVLKEAVEYP